MGSGQSQIPGDYRREYFASEVQNCAGTEEEIDASELKEKKVTTCIVKGPAGTVNGFFIELPFPSGEPLRGLMTTSSVLDSEHLGPGSSFSIITDLSDDEEGFPVVVDETMFVFTCQLLDVTFVQLPSRVIEMMLPVFFVPSDADCERNDRVVIKHYPLGGQLSITPGVVVSPWGFDVLHTASSDLQCEGCPLLNTRFEVVGVCKGRSNNAVEGVATRMSVILTAIRSMHEQFLTCPERRNQGRLPARRLSDEAIAELETRGLRPTESPWVFISPATLYVTPLLFFRTNHSWYWTPIVSHSHDIHDLRECNWSIIRLHEDIRAIGGFWNGAEPASRNVLLIESLSETGLKYL